MMNLYKTLSLPPPPFFQKNGRKSHSRPAGNEKKPRGFTLPEMMIAISLFAFVVTVISSLYIQSFRETRKANLQNQVYEDARFVLARIAQEIQNGTVDYDEYYNQNVVHGNYGQNFGRYYSSFFNPGTDNRLGFDCNDGTRNVRDCTPLRKTADRNTGANPFDGKYNSSVPADAENAFCGIISYAVDGDYSASGRQGSCDSAAAPPQNELYLISADGSQKTILAREKIGTSPDMYVLSLLRMNGTDTNNDSVYDHFECALDFQCTSDADGSAATLPRTNPLAPSAFDTAANGFSRDFVPISPLRVNITNLQFIISPQEDAHYAFAETDVIAQPRVTIMVTVAENPGAAIPGQVFTPITFTQTVYTRLLTPVPAPVLIQ